MMMMVMIMMMMVVVVVVMKYRFDGVEAWSPSREGSGPKGHLALVLEVAGLCSSCACCLLVALSCFCSLQRYKV